MKSHELLTRPIAKAEMLIRRPVAEVFEAFIDPAVTSQFWFTKSTGKLERDKRIRWDWEMSRALRAKGAPGTQRQVESGIRSFS